MRQANSQRVSMVARGVLLAAVMATAGAARGDVLADWNFTGVSGFGASPFAPNVSTTSNLTVGGLTRGSGVTTSGTAAGNAWGGTGFSTMSELDAINASDVAAFSFTATAGYSLSFSDIPAYNIRRSNTGPQMGAWQYQIGGGAFVDIGSPITWGSSTSASGNNQAAIDLSGIGDLQNVAPGTTVTFRIVNWLPGGSGGSAGTWYFNAGGSNKDLIINGSVLPAVVDSPNYFWIGADGSLGGSGTWGASGPASWSASDTTVSATNWDAGKTAVFKGAGGTVTVDGAGVTSNANIRFDANNYVISGGAMTLGGPLPTVTVTNAGDTARVASELAGPNGLTKAGLGTLVMEGNNSYAGNTTIAAGTLQVGNGGTSGVIVGNVTNSGVLAFNRSDDVAFTGDVAGTGSLTKLGGNTLTLTGHARHTGGTTVSTGTLRVGDGGTSGSLAGDVTVAGGATLAFSRTDDVTFAGNVSGGGSLTQAGAAKLILTGNASHGGGTTIASGTLQVGSGGTAGSLTGSVLNNGTLAFNRSDDAAHGGNISGNGNLVKQGQGVLTLSGNNSYQGGTTLSGGTLRAAGSSALGTGTVTATNGRFYADAGTNVANAIVVSGAAAGGMTVGQDFDALAAAGSTWANDSTLPGWHLFKQPAPGADITSITQGSGTSGTGSFYSFGATGDGDRALGGVGSSGTYFGSPGPASGAVAGWIAVKLPNTSGANVHSFTISYDGEQWRNGGNASPQTMTLEYGFGDTFDAVNWMAPGGTFDFTTPVTGASAAALDGNAPENRVAGLGGTLTDTWSAGANLWVRWVENNDTGNDHGLAIDNFSLTTGSGGGAVTLGGDATGGTAAYTGNVTLNSPVSLTAASGGTVAFSGVIADGSSSNGVTKVGDGVVALNGDNTYTGGTTVTSGTLVVGHGHALAGGPLAINGTGIVRVADGLTNPVVASTLAIDDSGKFDVAGGKAVLTASTAETVRQYLLAGRNGGSWDGSAAIISSTAAADGQWRQAVGYATGADLLGLAGSGTGTWFGQAVDATSVLLKFTWYGDANLDGKVSADDYALLDRGFAKSLTGWVNGDFDYSGIIDSADYMLIDRVFAQSNGGILSPTLLATREAQFGSGYVTELIAAVPEPTAAGLAVAFAVPALARRRRPR